VPNTLSYRLLVGRIAWHSSSSQTYTMVQWDNAQLAGRTIVKADLHLFQYHSGSCTPRKLNIHPLNPTLAWDETTVVKTIWVSCSPQAAPRDCSCLICGNIVASASISQHRRHGFA